MANNICDGPTTCYVLANVHTISQLTGVCGVVVVLAVEEVRHGEDQLGLAIVICKLTRIRCQAQALTGDGC